MYVGTPRCAGFFFYCVTPEVVWGRREEARRRIWYGRIRSWVSRLNGVVLPVGCCRQEMRVDSDYRSRVW